MKILHTVEFYNPSVGGAQEVVKQISEQLVTRGHQVTVATSKLPNRTERVIDGVNIEEFAISGNAVRGFQGETVRYQEFLRRGDFDLMTNYGAQQWATDLTFPDLNLLQFKKVLIPCGFSALYDPDYAAYFADMPAVMRRYDHLIFHADHYRDTDFARQHGLTHWSIIPNGALQAEFEHPDLTFRQRYNIPADVPLLLTVGTHSGLKGHHLTLEAFRQLETPRAVLVIIGNSVEPANIWRHAIRPLLGAIRRRDARRLGEILNRTLRGGIGSGCLPDCRTRASDVNRTFAPRKRVLLLDLPRADVVAAYHAADLFVFGSNIEYSPLALFEALASQTPFLSLDCGNAAEIAAWSRGGVIAPTILKDLGFVDGDPAAFAGLVDDLLADAPRRQSLAGAGHQAWLERFTWEKIAADYEALYRSLLTP